MNRVLILLTFILLIAAGWIGWQRISEQPEQQHLQELQAYLHGEAEAIDLLEGDLLTQGSNLASVEASINTLQKEIDLLEEAHTDGIPEEIYADYEARVTRINNLVGTYNEALESYDRIYSGYVERVAAYNQTVAEANELADSLGSVWFIGQWSLVGGEN